MSQSSRGNEVIEYPYTYNYISTAVTTSVKVGDGALHAVIVEGGTAGTIIITDDAGTGSGNIIASFSSTNAIQSYVFDVIFTNGLTVVTSQATKLTISYV